MRSLITYWHLDILMVGFLVSICLAYYFLGGFIENKKARYFIAGYGLIILSVASPLHFLGENYLMSAHMTSHVILVLLAAPLLVLGIPDNGNKIISKFSDWLTSHPWLPWMTGVCVMWFWHIPVVFDNLFQPGSADASGSMGIAFLSDLHLISLILAGILFSWPVVGPVKQKRMATVHAVLYLSAACIFCSILGLMITFAPQGIFTHYEHLTDRFGFLQIIRNQNGISVLMDRQIAGLIMWVPGCLIYLSASIWLLMKWFKEKNSQPFLTSPHTEYE
jgi:putative membrane protein